MKEHKLLTAALDKLYENTGLRLEVVQLEPRIDGNKISDALVRLTQHGKDQILAVGVKTRITKETAGSIMACLQDLTEKGLLVTEYVSPAVGLLLRNNRVAFLDTAGNAFIHEPPIHIDIRGQKLPPKKWKEELKGAAYRPTGLQVVFGFLCLPELVNEPYRTVAEKVDVAHGTVGWVMRDLQELGFIIKLGRREKKLVKREELLRMWVERYAETLRPKQLLGRYQVEDLERLKKLPLKDYRAFWSGEPAAEKLTEYITPGMWTIYLHDDPKRLIVLNALKDDEKGNVELLKTFWAPGLIPWGNETVPPVLVYADLLASGQGRNLETAKIIYDRELVRFIGQD